VGKGFEKRGSYRDCASIWAVVENLEILFCGSPGVRGVDETGRDLQVKFGCVDRFWGHFLLLARERLGIKIDFWIWC